MADNSPSEANSANESSEAPVAEAPATDASVTPPQSNATPSGPAEKGLRFNFRYAPWKDVLEWFAEQADCSLVGDAPSGTFNYTDNRLYSSAEAIDVINSVLLTRGYTLVRHQRMLMVINLEDGGIPPSLVETVPMADLEKRGKYEVIKCLFPLGSMTPEDAETEIRPVLGPQGAMVVMGTAGQVLVTETGGNLRMIRDLLIGPPGSNVAEHALKFISAEDVLEVARPLLGLEEDSNTSEDIQISIGPRARRLFATGTPQLLSRLASIIPLVDVDPGTVATSGAPGGPEEQPQLLIHSVTTADPETVLAVLNTLLAGQPDVRLATDPRTGNLVAMATPSVHRSIKATLDEMQRDASRIEVIQLHQLDPQVAILAINKLFGGTEEGPAENGPQVDADLSTGRLLVRGSELHIKQIRELLGKMGEDEALAALNTTQQGTVRFFPLTGRAARTAVEEARFLWPAMSHKNRIRIVTPGRSGPDIRGLDRAPLNEPLDNRAPANDNEPPATRDNDTTGTPQPNSITSTRREIQRDNIQWVGYYQPAAEDDDTASPSDVQPAASGDSDREPAEIIISIGPGGIVIASEDTEALDEFESLLRKVTNVSRRSGMEFTIFPLQYATAEAASQLLESLLSASGDGASDTSSTAGGVLGLGGAGGVQTSGPVSIIADNRLNTLIVQADVSDLDMIEQLLEIVDRETSPVEVLTNGKPRIIPVFNTSAEEVAEVVKQVYANRIETGASSAQRSRSGGGSIQDLLRGGGFGGGSSRGGGGGSSRSSNGEEQKMTIGVDARSNSIIVTAVEPLFLQVEALVAQLDQAGITSDETMRVVTLRRANPDLVKTALDSFLGNSVQSNSTSTNNQSSSQTSRTQTAQGGNDQAAREQQIRRRIEFFNSIQRGGGGSGGFRPTPGGGSRTDGGRGGPGGGSRGGPGGGSRKGGR